MKNINLLVALLVMFLIGACENKAPTPDKADAGSEKTVTAEPDTGSAAPDASNAADAQSAADSAE